jgi:predicted membrane channel-forming protein YqfA (hemolysin III family)
LLVLLIVGSFAAVMSLPPSLLAQDLGYSGFADRRSFLGIPNFANVVSNVAFLLVGCAGLWLSFSRSVDVARASWSVFFLGVALVSVGSAYYHWAPRNDTLLWDLFPITIGFMGLFAALLCERVSARLERWLLGPAILVGLASVLYWRFFGDRRPYVWIQVAALLMIPAALLLFRNDRRGDRFLVIGFACYALAKGAEAYDHPIFGLTGGWISGHTLKHLLAALACFAIYAMLKQRRRAFLDLSQNPGERPESLSLPNEGPQRATR